MRIAFASPLLALLMLVSTLMGNVWSGQTPVQRKKAKSASHLPTKASKRKIPCKTPENAAICYWTHGRLSVYNGNPTLRLWKIGTHRMLGVYNGPSHFPPHTMGDNENPDLPKTWTKPI